MLIDCKAAEIVESVNYDFSALNRSLDEINLVSWISRCRKYDEIINRFILANPYGTIVNIGCGLDTYYERAINNSMQWFELDLPDVIDFRRKFFSETSNRKFISESFLKTDWFNQIDLKEEVLFISAGVFCYFEEAEIRDFLVKIADSFLLRVTF